MASSPIDSNGSAHWKSSLRELTRTDNVTNFRYIARAWLVAVAAIGLSVWFFQSREAAGLSWWWNVPVAVVAIVIVGASQHQLAGATHEATHHTLFRHRLLNELASDWLCIFPMFGSTYSYRLFHLLHHQYVNDHDRDPDFVVLEESGHWLEFPVAKFHFLAMVARQFLLIGPVRYMLARARYNAVGLTGKSPYRLSRPGSRLPSRITIVYLVLLCCSLVPLYRTGNLGLMLIGPLALWLCGALTFWLLPSRHWEEARLKPVYPRPLLASMRLLSITLTFAALTILKHATGAPTFIYYFVLWIVPLFTSFSFFMILRQVVQHGNADQGRVTNTRVFLVNPLVRYAVFPFGMDYHAPHHIYATVPHYRLPALHTFLLLSDEEYRRQSVTVENYMVPARATGERAPTVVEVLGPRWARRSEDVWVDDSVLENWSVEEKEAILAESRAARSSAS